MRPHLKKSNPEVWAEMLAICQEAAKAGEMPPEAFKRVRHIGFGYESFVKWIKAGEVPCWSRDGLTWKPNPKHL